MPPKKYKQLKRKDLKPLREKLHKEQNGICPLVRTKIPIEEMVIDHCHKRNKDQEIGEDGAGLIRGCISRFGNIIEGKITNSWKRTALDKNSPISLPEFLRNLADYLEQEPLPLIHPTEKPREAKKLLISSYNELKKIQQEKNFPEYPKSANITVQLRKLFKKYGIEPKLRFTIPKRKEK